MSKHDILTTEEVAAFKPDARLLEVLEQCRTKLGIEKNAMRVLDWGCGRGLCVAWLRENGYDAYGVDIDETPLNNGAPLLSSMGLDPSALLKKINTDNSTDFDDRFFHFIFSQQVLEHVRDLDSLAREISRLTAPGGMGVHFYPPHRGITEVHLFMPLVHWLPAGAARRAAVRFWLTLGKDPAWPGSENKSAADRALLYSNYLDEKTFYRKWNVIAATFRNHAFRAKCPHLKDRNLQKFGAAGKIASLPLISPIANAVILNSLAGQELMLEKLG